MKKRILAVLVVIALLATMFPMSALAAGGTYTKTESTGWTKLINGKKITVKSATLYNDGYRDEAGGTVSVSHKYTYLRPDGYWDYTASAKDGYVFNGWTTGSGSGYSVNGNKLRISYDGNKEYTATANFEFVGYTVNLNLGSGGVFDAPYNASSITLTNVPRGTLSIPANTINSGYDLTGWSGSTNITSSRTLNATYEYRVNFEGNTGITIDSGSPVWTSGHTAPEPTYTVADVPRWRFDGWNKSLSGITAPTTITANPAVERGYITLEITGNGNFAHEDRIEKWHDLGTGLHLKDSGPYGDIGWVFTGWLNNNTGEKLSKGVDVTVTGDCTYTAIFESIGSRYVNAYAYGANGRLNNNINGTYAQGTYIDLNTADPQPTTAGYEFKHWEEYIDSSDSWATVSENGAGEVWITVGVVNEYRAMFGLMDHTVTYQDEAGVSLGTESVTHGQDATAGSISLPSGTRIDDSTGWRSQLSNITDDKTVTVTLEYEVTFDLDGGTRTGGGALSQWVTYHGAAAAPLLDAPDGHHFDSWDKTFSDITAATDVTAQYEINTYNIDTTVTGGTITPDQTVNHGSDCTITYSAATGYHLVSVTVDGVDAMAGNENSYTFSGVTTGHTIDVVYEINTYNITTSVIHGVITHPMSVAYGNDAVITYSANTGYHLASVTVDGTPLADLTGYETSYTFVDVDATHTIDVVYAINTYDITTSVTHGTITPSMNVVQGDDAVITYSAATGYHLASVTVDGTPLADLTGFETSYTFSAVDAVHSIDVVFEMNTYNIDTTVTGGTITPDQTVNYGSDCTITYSAATGYHLVSVTVDGADAMAGNENSYTFSDVTAGHSIAVVYEINTYNITTSVTNGTITPSMNVTYGNDAAIAYSANTGYHLASVTVDGTPLADLTGHETSYTFSAVDAAHTIDVVFAINTYDITTSVTHGTITPSMNVVQGNDAVITYSAETGYHLASVMVDGSPVDITTYPDSYTFFSVDAVHSIAVVYEINTYAITTAVGNGTITGSQTVNYGDDCTITYSPNANHHLASVTVDGSPVDITTYPDSYTFSSVDAVHSIIVMYEIDTYTITTSVTGGTITPNQTVDHGDDCTIHYTPTSSGYHLIRVTVDGTDVDISANPSSYTFTGVVGDHAIDVEYEYRFTVAPNTAMVNGVIKVTYGTQVEYIAAGDSVTFTAVAGEDLVWFQGEPDTGYQFDKWHGTVNQGYVNDNGKRSCNIYDRTSFGPYAHFAPIVYTITYNMDGGVNDVSNPATYTIEDAEIVLADPNKTAYDFAGWTPGDTIPAGSTGDKVFDATWTPTVYTITYNMDGGVNNVANPATYTIEDAEIVLADPDKTAYDFAGWTPGDTIPAGSMGDKVFDATWTPTVYTITYNMDGGVNNVANPLTYTIEDAEIVLADPNKTAYDFAGWTPGDTIPAGSMGNKVFDATWTPTVYTITYNMDGGTNDVANPLTYTIEDAEIVLADPNKTAYDFAGWTPGDTIPAGSMGDKVFDATWTPTVYTITYNMDGGVNNSANPATYTIEDAEIVLADPNKTAYDFAGWTPGDTILAGSMGDKVFDATWTPTVYTITYNMDGGVNNSANPATYTIEDAEIVLTDPNKTAYDFIGWTPGDTIPAGSMGDKVFDAAWTPTVYTITYDLAGGSVTGVNPATYTTESEDITLINPTRTGYTFTGWAGTDLVDGTDNVTITTGSMGDRSYTATWAINTYTVTFVDHDGVELGTDVVAHGSDAVAPDDPTREGYTFSGWDRDLENVTSSFTVTATYTINTYTVTFVDYDGTVLKEQTVEWNKGATAPDDPERDGYDFTGWDVSFDSVKEDITVTAMYSEVVEVEQEAVPATKDTTEIDEEDVPKAAGNGFAWWWIPIIGGAALLLFLILFFWKRRKKDREAA